MLAIITYALPILPGQTGPAGDLEEELDRTGHRERYEELNRAAGVSRHIEWIQAMPSGDVLIVVFESDRPDRVARSFGEDDYDRWWRDRVRRIHGFDPAVGGGLPRPTFAWEASG